MGISGFHEYQTLPYAQAAIRRTGTNREAYRDEVGHEKDDKRKCAR